MTFDEKLAEIRRLLTEAYEHYFEHSDGTFLQVVRGWMLMAHFWREEPEEPSVEIYSYVLGPHRSHYFKNVDEALAEVRKWHRSEMEHDYSKEWDDE